MAFAHTQLNHATELRTEWLTWAEHGDRGYFDTWDGTGEHPNPTANWLLANGAINARNSRGYTTIYTYILDSRFDDKF